jgi:parallel beta-helix repeat protein
MKKAFQFLLVLFLLTQMLTAQPARAGGNTYYVSTTGNNGAPGTISQPWRTIQKAASALNAGDTVYIRGGTYRERVVPKNSGIDSENYITYAAYPGEKVTIDGSGVDVPEYCGLFDLAGRSYIRVSGLRVVNSAYYGIVADNSGYITIENNYTYNTYSSGISAWGSHHITVDHNEVTGSNTGPWQESLSISNTDTFEVRYNLVHDLVPGTDGKEGITIKDASTHGKVYGNQVYNLKHVGIYVDAEAEHLFDVEVYQNVVHGIDAMGISLASEQGGLLENIRVYNNISYDNMVGLWLSACCIATHPFKDIAIINNTFARNGRGGWGGGIGIENLQMQNVVIRNNIASQNIYSQMAADPGILSALTVDHNLTDGDRDPDYEFYGTDDLVNISPLFAYPSAADFHLRLNSPAIDSGSALGAPAVDFANRARDASIDIGAYEYDPAYSIRFFASSFDANFSGWSKTGSATLHPRAPRIGARSVRLAGNASIKRAIPTLGYENITLLVYLGAQSYERSEKLTLAWWNGSAWQTLIAIKNRSSLENAKLNRLTFTLPAEAANRADFQVRIQQTGAGLDDFGYIDSFQLSGTSP